MVAAAKRSISLRASMPTAVNFCKPSGRKMQPYLFTGKGLPNGELGSRIKHLRAKFADGHLRVWWGILFLISSVYRNIWTASICNSWCLLTKSARLWLNPLRVPRQRDGWLELVLLCSWLELVLLRSWLELVLLCSWLELVLLCSYRLPHFFAFSLQLQVDVMWCTFRLWNNPMK